MNSNNPVRPIEVRLSWGFDKKLIYRAAIAAENLRHIILGKPS